jgi:MFS family permease
VAVQAKADGSSSSSIFSSTLRTTSIGLLIVITMIAFEAMAVTTALPTAARELHGLAAYGWAFTGFLVASIVAMVASGEVCDQRGPRLPLIAGLWAFMLGLALAGSATTMVQLVAGRVVQGLGGGLMITAVYVVIGEAYCEQLRPKLFAATSSAWVLPSLVGPLVSGALSQHASWRCVFLGLLPFVGLGAVLLIPVLRTLQSPRRERQLPSRLVPATAAALGVAALEQAGQHPGLVSGALALVGLVVLGWGLRLLLPTGTFRVRPGVPAPIALRGLLAGAMFGVDSTLPLALSVQHHFGPLISGLPLTVTGVTWAFGSWLQGRADDTRGPQVRVRLIRIGFVCLTIATAAVAVALLPAVPGWLTYPAWMFAGLGAGLTMSSVGVLLLKFTTDARRGSDSASLQLSDTTATSITTGFGGVLIAAAAHGVIGFTAAFVTLALTMCAIAVVGIAAARRARPAPRDQVVAAP